MPPMENRDNREFADQVEDLELSETAEEVKTCLDVYTKERDKRKEAGTWKQPRKW